MYSICISDYCLIKSSLIYMLLSPVTFFLFFLHTTCAHTHCPTYLLCNNNFVWLFELPLTTFTMCLLSNSLSIFYSSLSFLLICFISLAPFSIFSYTWSLFAWLVPTISLLSIVQGFASPYFSFFQAFTCLFEDFKRSFPYAISN